jgi:cytidylate kinase
MSVVVISSVDEECRKELAESLARKLGCESIGREAMIERATEAGIALGKLEIAVLKRSAPWERLARDKARYLAFITAAVCERAANGNVVYHGRTAHLFFQGIPHVFKVCVIPDPERRLHRTMRRLGLDWETGKEYMRQLDDDLENWSHFLHGVTLTSPGYFDVVFNLQNMSIQSASAFLCSMLQSPEFQPTPASLQAMENLYLAAQARDRLMRDERTGWADLNVTAQDGRITITYMPGQSRVSHEIPAVLSGLEGAGEIVCTMATTNILWVADKFDPSSSLYGHIVDVARRWGAAVELMRLRGLPEEVNGERTALPQVTPDACGIGEAPVPKALDMTGGVHDDNEQEVEGQDDGLAITTDRLIERNIFGGASTITGRTDGLVSVVKSDHRYSLIVIGDVFTSRSASIRVRLKREIAGLLRERVSVPVMVGDELQEKFLFGKRQLAQLLVFLGIAAVLFLMVFTHQEQILNFLAGPAWKSWRIAATVGVALIVPVFAYFYGGASGLILKLLKFR